MPFTTQNQSSTRETTPSLSTVDRNSTRPLSSAESKEQTSALWASRTLQAQALTSTKKTTLNSTLWKSSTASTSPPPRIETQESTPQEISNRLSRTAPTCNHRTQASTKKTRESTSGSSPRSSTRWNRSNISHSRAGYSGMARPIPHLLATTSTIMGYSSPCRSDRLLRHLLAKRPILEGNMG